MLSQALMGHPRRRHFIDELAPQLPGAELVLDRENDRWETGRRALLAFDPAASHHLVVQDDAILCRDFLAGAELAAEAAGEHPVCLYTGAALTHARVIRPAAAEARRLGTPWLAMEGPWWGVGLVIPTVHIPELVSWCDRRRLANYDLRIAAWYRSAAGLKCWYTLPSLVDHRPVAENPSLVAGRTADRRAYRFIGKRSPLKLHWDRAPVDGDGVQMFRHRGTAESRRATRGSTRHRQLSRLSEWEAV